VRLLFALKRGCCGEKRWRISKCGLCRGSVLKTWRGARATASCSLEKQISSIYLAVALASSSSQTSLDRPGEIDMLIRTQLAILLPDEARWRYHFGSRAARELDKKHCADLK
jgi:hypothetical protein